MPSSAIVSASGIRFVEGLRNLPDLCGGLKTVSIHVIVKLYSHLRERAQNPDGTVRIESPQGLSVKNVVHSIGLMKDDAFLILINKEKGHLEDTLQNGDCVEIFPIVGGG